MSQELKDKGQEIRDELEFEANTAKRIGGWMVKASDEIDLNKQDFEQKIEQAELEKNNNKGIFGTKESLEALYPSTKTKEGFYAFVGLQNPRQKYVVQKNAGAWVPTDDYQDVAEIDLEGYLREDSLTTEITQEKDSAPSNYAVKQLELSILGQQKGKEVIPYSIGGSALDTRYSTRLIYENQSVLQGSKITMISAYFVQKGTLSILRCVKEGDVFQTSIIKKVLIDDTGQQDIYVDIKLRENEYIGFLESSDSARFNYIKDSENSVGKGFHYYNPSTGKWSLLVANMGVGISILVADISLANKVEQLEDEIEDNFKFKPINRLNPIIHGDILSSVNSMGNIVEINVPQSDTPFEDKLYLNGDLSQDFAFSFSFDNDNRTENITNISLFLEKKDGTHIVLERFDNYRLRVSNASSEITRLARFESKISFRKIKDKLQLKVANEIYVFSNIEIKSAYFKIVGGQMGVTYFIKNIVNSIPPITLPMYGLMFPYIGHCQHDTYVLLAYFNKNEGKHLIVSKIDITNGTIESKVFTNISLTNGYPYDSHRYWDIGVDAMGGVHIMGNCHDTNLYYLYGDDFNNLDSIKIVSDSGLLMSRVTYPEFLLSDEGFYATYRIGKSTSGYTQAFIFADSDKKFTKTTDMPIADGTATGATAYFSRWINNNGWFYTTFCWRSHGGVDGNSQINLIKTKDFTKFNSWSGEELDLPILKKDNAPYIIDNVPENSGLINQWYIIPFVFNGMVHVWYMKYDENRHNNIYLVYPNKNGYTTKKITDFAYTWNIYGGNTIDLSPIQVTQISTERYLYLHIRHILYGNITFKVDVKYNISEEEFLMGESISDTNKFVVTNQSKGILYMSETDRAYYDTVNATTEGMIRLG